MSSFSDDEYASGDGSGFEDDDVFDSDAEGEDDTYDDKHISSRRNKLKNGRQTEWLDQYRVSTQLLPCYRYTLPGDLSDISIVRHEHFLLTTAQTTQSRQLRTLREVVAIPQLLHLLHFYFGSGRLLSGNAHAGIKKSKDTLFVECFFMDCNEWSTGMVLLQLLMSLLASDESVHAIAPGAASDATNTPTVNKNQQVKQHRKKRQDDRQHSEHRNIWGEYLADLEVLIPFLVINLLSSRVYTSCMKNCVEMDRAESVFENYMEKYDNDGDEDPIDKHGDVSVNDIGKGLNEIYDTKEHVVVKLEQDFSDVMADDENACDMILQQDDMDDMHNDCKTEASLLPTVKERRKSETSDEVVDTSRPSSTGSALDTTSPSKGVNPGHNAMAQNQNSGQSKESYSFLCFSSCYDSGHIVNRKDETKPDNDVAQVHALLERLHKIHQYHASFDKTMQFITSEQCTNIRAANSFASLAVAAVESLCDLLLGRPGALKLHGDSLLNQSWDLSSAEPHYTRYQNIDQSIQPIITALETARFK